MARKFLLSAKHMAGGFNSTKGEMHLSTEENIESRNMEYTPDGSVVTSLGYAQPSGWASVETGVGIDGLFVSQNYPDLIFKAVNGKIKQSKSESTPFYNVDTALSLTAGNRVLMREYRGNVYFANSVQNLGRIAVAQLQNAELAGSTTWELNDNEAYRFTNGADKVYAEGDEVDYTAVSVDDLTTVTNGLGHAAGTYVTQYNTLTAPPSGSLQAKAFAFFRDTLWYAAINEPNVVRYSKTVSSIATVGNVNDLSDGNNYMIGEGGKINALHSTRDRLYIFTSDKVHYITTELNSSGAQVFSVDRIFTPNYGCPNPFCVTDMEDVTVFFTGRRLIRIGYAPNVNQLLPDEKFDEEIFPTLAMADSDQSNASLFYNSATKKLFITFSVGGVLKTIVYQNRLDKFSYNWDHDTIAYVQYRNASLFGDRADDNVWKFGLDLDADGTAWPHILRTGRWVGDAERYGGRRKTQRYVRGVVTGKLATGTIINFTINVNGKAFGGTRMITDARADASSYGTALGMITAGMDTVGGTIASTNVRNFRYPFLVSAIGEDIQFQFSSLQLGAFWQIDNVQIEGFEYPQLPYTHF